MRFALLLAAATAVAAPAGRPRCPCPPTPPHCPAGPTVESPLYLRWARFKPGTRVVYRETSEVPGQDKTEQQTSYQLMSVSDDKVVVAVKVEFVEAGGKLVANPSQEFTHAHRFELPAGAKAEDYDRPKGATAAPDETVELLGQKFACKVYKSTGRYESGPTATTTWLSDQVPGGLLRTVVVASPNNKTTTTVVSELAPAS